ncbi:hypothetical protein EGW08_019036 [Elysia chlorotica]|uniref:Uncharacterized protein n=1 Tax=Elysia chlorotica TaxID=188477 RepID=A0A433SVA8_ELYCH|nr:hypothetical protein EGW08_019036 [Elysia chlorotica]
MFLYNKSCSFASFCGVYLNMYSAPPTNPRRCLLRVVAELDVHVLHMPVRVELILIAVRVVLVLSVQSETFFQDLHAHHCLALPAESVHEERFCHWQPHGAIRWTVLPTAEEQHVRQRSLHLSDMSGVLLVNVQVAGVKAAGTTPTCPVYAIGTRRPVDGACCILALVPSSIHNG